MGSSSEGSYSVRRLYQHASTPDVVGNRSQQTPQGERGKFLRLRFNFGYCTAMSIYLKIQLQLFLSSKQWWTMIWQAWIRKILGDLHAVYHNYATCVIVKSNYWSQITSGKYTVSQNSCSIAMTRDCMADQAAKNSAGRPQEFIPIRYRDWLLMSREGCMSSGRRVAERRDFICWYQRLDTSWIIDVRKRTRRDKLVINRLRLGHTRVTRGFMFNPELECLTTVWTVQGVCC